MRTRYAKILRYVFKLLGPALLVYILWRIDLGVLLDRLADVSVWLYVAALALGLVTPMFKAIRWRGIVRANPGADLPVLRSYAYYLAGAFLGAVTPGRVGELYKVSYLRDHGLSFGRSAATVLVDRIFDVVAPLVLGCIGLALHPDMPGADLGKLVGLVAIAAAGLAAAYIMRNRLRTMLLRIITKLSGPDRSEQIDQSLSDFAAGVRAVGPGVYAACVILTLAAWAVYCGQREVIALAIGMDVDVVYFAVVFTVAALLSMLPISIVGIGTRDAALVYFLGRVGVGPEEAVTLSSLILLAMLFKTLIGCGAFVLVVRRAGGKGD